MQLNLEWQEAEDSFLRYFCKIEEFSWGRRYSWDKGDDWAKFNFIRILDASISFDELKKIIDINKLWFKKINRNVNIKVPSIVSLGFDITEIAEPTGIPICYFQFNSAEIPVKTLPEYSCHRCESIEELKVWWDINSAGRSREDQLQSPLWPVIQRMAEDDTEFYLIKDSCTSFFTTCFAITKRNGKFNLFGEATRPEFQRKGYHAASRFELKNNIVANTVLNVQVNLQDKLETYYSSVSHQTQRYMEKRYVCK